MNNNIRPIDANKFEVVWLANCSDEITEGAKYILEMIDKAPTLKYEPVKHGHWIANNVLIKTVFARNCHCSECGFEPMERTKRCPNCGAKMDAEKTK